VDFSVSWVLRLRRFRAADFSVLAELFFLETLAPNASLDLRDGLRVLDVFRLRVGFFLAIPGECSTRDTATAKAFLAPTGRVECLFAASEYDRREVLPRDSTAREQD